MNWHDEAQEMYLCGKSISEISKLLNINYNAVRSFLRRYRVKQGICISNETKSVKVKSKYSYANGIGTYEDEIQIIDGQEITPEIIMRAKGLKTDDWEVVSFTRNVWQQQTQGGGTIDLCQSKLSVKPKKVKEITFEDIDNYFSRDNKNVIKSEPFDYNESNEVLEIDVADLHDGLLAWKNETGSDFDLKICSEKFLSAILDVSQRARERKLKKFISVLLVMFCTLITIKTKQQKAPCSKQTAELQKYLIMPLTLWKKQ